MGNSFNKPFLTYDQQIEKLIIKKKLKIRDKNYAINLLKKYSYFDLISGYKKPFKGKDGNYKIHASIDDILIVELLEKKRILDKKQLYKYMGFPENWLEIRKCNKILVS